MNLKISNIEYNLIRKKMQTLEEAYVQSCDDSVRKTAKEIAYLDLCMQIPGFYELFKDEFEKCQMTSLREITELSTEILSRLDVHKLSTIEVSQAKKVLKLKEKTMNQFLRGYNQMAKSRPLTYYSQQIDEKMVFLYYQDGQFMGVVGNISKTQRRREALCVFCNNFRNGEEIVFVTNAISSNSGDYSSIGLYCCKDTEKCNSSILNTDKLSNFMTYNGKQKINRR